MKTTDSTRLITLAELMVVLSMSRSMIYLKLDPKSPYYDPDFPERRRISKRSIRFLWDDVQAYIEKIKPVKAVKDEQGANTQ